MLENSDNNDSVIIFLIKEWAILAKKKIEENKTWLNKHIFKKLAVNNFNLMTTIIKNITRYYVS